MDDIKIEHGIPVPPRRKRSFPFEKLNVGESFFVEGVGTWQISGHVARAKKRLPGWVFTTRTEHSKAGKVMGTRVWREKDEEKKK
jgi:hypothetical protein